MPMVKRKLMYYSIHNEYENIFLTVKANNFCDLISPSIIVFRKSYFYSTGIEPKWVLSTYYRYVKSEFNMRFIEHNNYVCINAFK